MGHNSSKVALASLQAALQKDNPIDALVKDEKTLELMKELWGRLSEHQQDMIVGDTRDERKRRKVTRKPELKPIVAETSIITKCKQWAQGELQIAGSLQVSVEQNPFLCLYFSISQSFETRQLGRILPRFHLLLFNRLIRAMEPYLPKGGISLLAIDILGVQDIRIDRTRKNITKNITKWNNGGVRYEMLVKQLGSGCLMLLPDDIGDTMYEHHLAVKDCPKRTEFIQHLRDRGIEDVIEKLDANRIADEILSRLQDALGLPDLADGLAVCNMLQSRQANDSLASSRLSTQQRQTIESEQQTYPDNTATAALAQLPEVYLQTPDNFPTEYNMNIGFPDDMWNSAWLLN